ncbi:MAG: single-stranded DNA-binding protein [Actinomycetes bacterium]
MSRSLNSVCVSGHLGRAPKVFANDDGSQSATLTIAVNVAAKVDGEWEDRALWVDCRVYGAQVPSIAEFLDKGSMIMVEGRLAEPRSWSGDDGELHVVPVIVAKSVVFGPRVDGGNGDAPAPRKAAPKKAAPISQAEADAIDDDDLPF